MLKSTPHRFFILSILAGLAIGIIIFYATLSPSPLTIEAEALTLHSTVTSHPINKHATTSYHEAVSIAAPSVVSVYTSKKVQWEPQYQEPLFNDLFAPRSGHVAEEIKTNQGSGVIITLEGHIITNEHLVRDVDEITVQLNNGQFADALLIGTDPATDLAVIKINSENKLPAITLSHENNPNVGDIVLAIGNPFGVGQTVTMGIVSAIGRPNPTGSALQEFIQIDAAINPGNSGGALINPLGELVGINTAVASYSDGAQGIGFAVPLRLVKHVAPQIINHQQVKRGWLGLVITSNNWPIQPGLEISGIFENSPAHIAGLQKGDRLTHINSVKIKNAHQLLLEITTTIPGTTINISGFRGQQAFSTTATLTQPPDSPR